MRLKKLTLQAFGPFRDRVEIDFEKNKIDRGLLLITGDTGAGKTTIFDAICFALYGESSGDTRTVNSLRSDWASPDEETFVDLEFYYKGKQYEVRRTPEYMRTKQRGEGLTKHDPTAEIDLDGKIITKLDDVTRAIENLIGLNYKQFKQVAMLSQGEFTKFLLAESDEKTEIFRKIFGTEFYDELQNRLKHERMTKESEMQKVKDKIDTEKVNLEKIIDLNGLSNEEMSKVLDEKIESDNKNVQDLKKNRDLKNEEQTKLTNELHNLEDLNKKIADYNDASEKLKKLKLQENEIKKDNEIYDYNINVAFSVSKILENLKRYNKDLEDKKEQENSSKESLNSNKKEYDSKKEKYDELGNYSKNMDDLNNKIIDINNKIENYNTFLNKNEELEKEQKKYSENTEKYAKENDLLENMKKEYYLNISVEIAENLKDGEPCPVCGSVEHPKIATPTESKYTKSDLDAQEKLVKKIESARKSNEAKIEELRKVISDLGISFENTEDVSADTKLSKENIANSALEDSSNLEKLYKFAKSEIERLQKEYSEKNSEKKKLEEEFNKLSKEKETLTAKIKTLEESLKLFSEDIKKLTESIDTSNQELDNIYKEHKTNYEDYKAKCIDTASLKKLKNKIDEYNKNVQELDSKKKTLEPEVKGKEITDTTQKQEQLNKITEEHSKLDEEYTKLNATLELLKNSAKNIKKYSVTYLCLQKQYKIVKIISDTANGNLVSKQKITFEKFVQSYFMDTVLVEANKRLDKMTDSRYELKKKETPIKKSVKAGLDFSIFDSYTGKERDVTSLSGGEKFKASLSLALGLSDTISNNRGGIRIDSLFIDEGFGSLDSESLNQALNILSDLSGNDKLVGVISHISELMNRIDNKIIVDKTNTGSVLKIEAEN